MKSKEQWYPWSGVTHDANGVKTVVHTEVCPFCTQERSKGHRLGCAGLEPTIQVIGRWWLRKEFQILSRGNPLGDAWYGLAGHDADETLGSPTIEYLGSSEQFDYLTWTMNPWDFRTLWQKGDLLAPLSDVGGY